MGEADATLPRDFDQISAILRTLLAVLIGAGVQRGHDTETMLRMYCAGYARVVLDEEADAVDVVWVPEGREQWLRAQRLWGAS